MLLNEQLDRRGKPKGVSKPLSYYVFSAMLKQGLREFYRCPHKHRALPRHYSTVLSMPLDYVEQGKVSNGSSEWSVEVGLCISKRVSQWVKSDARFETIVRVAWSPREATRVTYREDCLVYTPDLRTAVETVVCALTAC
jgi:hypothetical protein